MTGMAIEGDFRKLALATQAELRRIAVAMVRAGKTRIEAAEAVGVNRQFVGRGVRAAEQGGEAALAGGRRGHRPGERKESAEHGAERQAVRPDRPGVSPGALCRPQHQEAPGSPVRLSRVFWRYGRPEKRLCGQTRRSFIITRA